MGLAGEQVALVPDGGRFALENSLARVAIGHEARLVPLTMSVLDVLVLGVVGEPQDPSVDLCLVYGK